MRDNELPRKRPKKGQHAIIHFVDDEPSQVATCEAADLDGLPTRPTDRYIAGDPAALTEH